MEPIFAPLTRAFARTPGKRVLTKLTASSKSQICIRCQYALRQTSNRQFHAARRRLANPADSPGFTSVLDNPPVLIKTGRRNPFGLVILAIIPLTAFALGTWQVQRLSWKSDLIAKFEDRLLRPPLPLPPQIDATAIPEFDYRRIYAKGRFLHEQEMLVGPRLHDGENGYIVITPFARADEEGAGSTILVNRGWVAKDLKEQSARSAAGAKDEALPQGSTTVLGLLREPPKGNRFTPVNDPASGAWYFPNIVEMAAYTGSTPVYVEQTMDMELTEAYRRAEKGIPIGRAAEVNLRNNHAQYIFTWYALGLATSVMLWLVVKRKPIGAGARVRRNTGW